MRCQAGEVVVKKAHNAMSLLRRRTSRICGWIGLAAAACSLWASQAAPSPDKLIKLEVDATDAPRRILHARLQIPTKPGKLTLVYPKWLPGEHSPTGPITDLVGLKMTAAGKAVEWRRDAEDMYAFTVEVPAGADLLDVALDYLSPPGGDSSGSSASATAKLVDLNWNEVLLYPRGTKASELRYAATLRLPEGWQFGSALVPVTQSGGVIEFEPVSLETLVDSPVIAGAHFRTIDLSPGGQPPHALHIVADSESALELKPEDSRRFARLVPETGALFGARHYRGYHFLLTLSDHVAHFGLEHHESSDNRQCERYFADADSLKLGAGLLPHEMTHSWNGKYRRPAGLATPDFQQPMRGELLWVYEGLTDYLGVVLTARCGLWTDDDFRQWLALEAASLDHQPGRVWRPLADTTVAAQLLYGAREDGHAWRRGVEFYGEGALIWLEADVLIRQQSQGRRSLDDFCKRFYGGQSGPPRVVPYAFGDVVAALNEIARYDWRQFFQARVYTATPRAPLGGIANAGWLLSYTNTPSAMLKSSESVHKFTDLRCSLGLAIKESGGVQDVIPGSPADQAGIGAGMQLVAVNGRRWTPDLLRIAIRAAKTNSAPIELLVENADFFKSCKVDYHDGEKYPWLARAADKPDVLAEILRPRASAP
jgi:predicted metalloprotease with PDZ domain